MNFSFDEPFNASLHTVDTLRAWLKDLPIPGSGLPKVPDLEPIRHRGPSHSCERTDWMDRVDVLLTHGESRRSPVDRFAQFRSVAGKVAGQLLDTLSDCGRRTPPARVARAEPGRFSPPGAPPRARPGNLVKLLAYLGAHTIQSSRPDRPSHGRQYTDAVGPWVEYLPMLGAIRGELQLPSGLLSRTRFVPTKTRRSAHQQT